jgi:rSAM/selenodomain-associated transferase 2
MKVSVIIPALNEQGQIGKTLEAVSALGNDLEIIVVDGGSSDTTKQIALAKGAQVYDSVPGRARQMNLGAELSTGDALLFLHADTQPPPTALASIVAALSRAQVSGGSFRLKFDYEHPILRFSSWLSRLDTPLIHYGDSGYFVSRSAFRELGGFRDIPILEDFDFFSRLSRRFEIEIIKEPVITSARRFVEKGCVKLQLLSVLVVLLYLLGAPPTRVRRFYDWAQ